MSIPDPAPDLWKLEQDPTTKQVIVVPVDYLLSAAQGTEHLYPGSDPANDPELSRAEVAGLRRG